MKIKIDDIEKIKLDVKLIHDLIIYFLNNEYVENTLIENIDIKDNEIRMKLRKANNKYYATRTFLNITYDYLSKIREDLDDTITLYYKEDE